MFPLWVSEIIEAMVHMAKSNQLKFIGNSTGFRMVSALQVNLGILQIDPGLNDTKGPHWYGAVGKYGNLCFEDNFWPVDDLRFT